MKLLCVLVLLIVVSSDANGTSEADFYGTWTLVELFLDHKETLSEEFLNRCSRTALGPGETTCSCNGVDLVTFNITEPYPENSSLPGAIANTHEEAIRLERSSCQKSCGPEFKVFRKLDKNYIIFYYSAKGNMVPDAGLLAKSVPSLTALNAFVSNLNEFNDKAKYSFCVTDNNN